MALPSPVPNSVKYLSTAHCIELHKLLLALTENLRAI